MDQGGWAAERIGSDDHVVGDGGVLDHNDDAVADVEAELGAVRLLDVVLVDDGDVVTNAGVLIEDRPLHGRSTANPDGSSTPLAQGIAVGGGLKEVVTHHQGVLEDGVLFDTAADTEDAVVNAAGLQD